MDTNVLCKTINALFLVLFVLIGSSIASAQVTKTPGTKKPVAAPGKPIDSVRTVERPVTVAFKEGEPISGKFVSGTADGVQIVVAGNTLLLKWNDIAKITFTDAVIAEPLPKAPSAAEKSAEAIANALKALRKLSSATEVGVSFQAYRGGSST
jgi:endonuclease YncB( thermonuclease family)